MASNIQNQILTRLLSSQKLRYSDMKPDDITSDLFNYHLQFLVKKGLVLKEDDGYSLSTAGIKHVADEYPLNPRGEVANLFKMNVITIVSQNSKNGIQILNQVRERHPSFGKKGVMGGSVRKCEEVLDGAKRKLQEETGLSADFRVLGFERRILNVGDELFSDIIYCLCYADEVTGDLKAHTEFGINRWVSLDEALKNDEPRADSIESISKILKAIKDGGVDKIPLFFHESKQVEK